MKIKHIYIIISFLYVMNNSYAQTLQDYLLEAEKNSLELQSKQYSYQSALEKVNEVGSVANATIGAGYFVQEAETRVGAQKAKLSVSQTLPWFGTLSAKKESVSLLAEAQLNTIDLTKRALFLEVKKNYFQLYELKQKENILNENIKILDIYEKLALNELENNRSSMVDVLKIKIEKNEVYNNLNTIIENLNAKQIVFNLILNKDENAPIKILDTILIEDYNDLLSKNLILQNPRILQLENIKASLSKSEEANKKESLPTIGLGLDYIFVEERPDLSISNNGKDIIMPMVKVSFPLFSNKYSSKQKQLQLEQKAIETKKADVTNQLFSLYESTVSRLKNAENTIKTQADNIIQTDQAQKVLLAAYQTAKMDFNQILEVQQLKLKFQLSKIASEKEYAIQKAMLEFLIK